MKTILDGTSRRVGAIFNEIDVNFIEVCNALIRIAYPEYTLKGYAETEPASPVAGDCYLVLEDATIWGMTVEKNDILRYTGLGYDPETSGSGSGSGDSDGGYIWEILPFKITELNDALQWLFFDADKIVITPIAGITGNSVQTALEEIAAALVLQGILNPDGSGSGSV
jgi:hypothetical protein